MKLLLLGATGRTGRLVLKSAIGKGYQLNCLVRNPKKIENQPGVHIIKGKVNNSNDLKKSMLGCQGVISVLNISRKTDFPWSPLVTPENLLSDVITNVISIASETGPRRVVICSAWGVHETKAHIPKWFKWLINYSNVGMAYKEHERQERLLESSGLDWTIVRPVGLTNSQSCQAVRESIHNFPKPSLTISRLSLANYLVECFDRHDLVHEKVVVSKD